MPPRAVRAGLLAIGLAAPALPAQRAAAPKAVPPAPTAPVAFDSTVFGSLRWRELGPARGGRSVAVAGSAKRPNEYWMGTTGGGVFKTSDGGLSWAAASDAYFGGTIGAIAVDAQNPDVVWVGGGETDIRGNTAPGDGLWKTTDGGRTWKPLGFANEHIAQIRIHPTNANVAWLAVFGDPFKAGSTRGVYKTTDGGATFQRVLFVNDSTGAIDLALDPSNPDVLYAAMWQAYRTPWSMSSGGVHSGLWKSVDGGATWSNLVTSARGLPQGILGKIGVTVSPAKPSRVWAIVEHDSGGIYRSDDAGRTWSWINQDRKLRQRAWYYAKVVADPKDTNVVYAMNVGFYRSRDGGRTFKEGINTRHPDNHQLWIAPDDPNRMIESNDGGANISTDGGRHWTEQNFATAQFYHVDVNNAFPYMICGAQQDNSTLCGPSRGDGRVTIADWKDGGGGESGFVTPHPTKPDIVFAGSYGGLITRKDLRTGFTRDVTVYPINPMGWSSKDIKVRFQWTFPIVFSRHDPKVLYAAGSQLFRSTDEGESWQAVSPELARRAPHTMEASGGPITKDQTGVETYALIFAFDESPVTRGLLWVGTDDGLVWVSRDNGAHWTNVTPPGIGDFTRISMIEPSHFDAGTAYVAANRYQQGDKAPILYRTTDYGATWTRIVDGIAPTHFLRTVREDPARRGFLAAGTERGVYLSYDDGRSWHPFRRGLPPVPVHDLSFAHGDLIAATHGRSFWVLDNIAALEQLTPPVVAKPAHLFDPGTVVRADFGGGFFAMLAMLTGGAGPGTNPPSGALFQYHLKSANQVLALDILDSTGTTVAHFTSDPDPATLADSLEHEHKKQLAIDSLVARGWARDSATRSVVATYDSPAFKLKNLDFEELVLAAPRPPRVPNKAGINRFTWDLRYPMAVRFDGLIFWAGTTNGPVAPPGRYTVRLSAPGVTESRTFRLVKDPRADATDADLREQFRLHVAIRDKLSEANNAVRTVRNMRAQVDDRTPRLAGALAEQFRQLAGEMVQQISASEGEIYQVKNQALEDPLNFPIKLNNQIASLGETVGMGNYRPTKQARDAFTSLSTDLGKQTTALKGALDKYLPRLNDLLKQAGLPPLVPSTEEVKKPGPKVAM
jgi:photosystem II stability/assembly factor-like uncharacterized protein